jgi:hypothetical protein
VTGEADALATLWWRMLSSRSAWEVVVQRFSKRVTGGWGAAGMAEESSFAAGVRAREGANTASDGHSQELRYSAGEAAGADAVLLCGRWRGRAGGEAWGAHLRCGRRGDAARPGWRMTLGWRPHGNLVCSPSESSRVRVRVRVSSITMCLYTGENFISPLASKICPRYTNTLNFKGRG